MTASHKRTFADVLMEEHRDIRNRRVQAGMDAPARAESETLKTVGLALSGGGVRSSAISLGLLQALYDNHVLNQFDYLSTVSGGTYMGVHLTASLEDFPKGTTIDWGLPKANEIDRNAPGKDLPADTSLKPSRPLYLAKDPDGSLPGEVRRLLHSGPYLRRFSELASATLFGVVINWLMLLSGLTALACAIAYVYRFLDHPKISAIAEAAGFSGDLRRAFVIPFGVFLCWVVAHVNYARGKAYDRQAFWSRVAAWLSILLFVSLACALILVLKTGDLDILGAGRQSSDNVAQATQSVQTGLWTVALIALLFSLLPFFWKNELLRSGSTSPKKHWHSYVAKVTGWGLLAGLPLLLFGMVVGEDLFGYNSRRDNRYELSRLGVRDWVDFAETVERDAALTTPHSQMTKVLPWFNLPLGPQLEDAANHTPAGQREPDRLATLAQTERERRKIQAETYLVARWLTLPLVPFGKGPMYRQWEARTRSDRLTNEIVASINKRVISNPLLFRAFPPRLPSTHPLSHREDKQSEFQAIREQARRSSLLPETGTLRKWLELPEVPGENAIEDLVHGQPLFGEHDESKEQQREHQRVLDVRKRVQAINRELLQLWYGDKLRPQNTVFALNVLSNDQLHRIWIGVLCLGTVLLLGLFVVVNLTSAHRYYRDRLAEMWIFLGRRTGTHIQLSQMKNTDHGGPYHLINAAANLFGPRRAKDQEVTDSFLFSRRYCGSDRVDYESTETYDRHGITLADAMAISGAAVSPALLTQNPVLMYALLLSNARLGKWIPNPADALTLRHPTFIRALFESVWHKPEKAAYLYVSDGGHHENTGIGPLLKRRAKVIVACDASCDPEYQFLDILRLMRRKTGLHGIHFTDPAGGPVNFEPLVPNPETRLSRAHCVLIRIQYPHERGKPADDNTGWLLYTKSTLTRNDPAELREYQKDNREFPSDTTLDQFFDARRFECYRNLGYTLGLDVVERLKKPRHLNTCWLAERDWSPPAGGNAVDEPKAAPKEPAAGEAPLDLHGEQQPFNEETISKLPNQPGVFILLNGSEIVTRVDTKKARKHLLSLHRCSGALKHITSFVFTPYDEQARRGAH